MKQQQYYSDASTDPGHVRRRNEDAVYEDRALGIYFVVDGMGGQAAGEQAARIAVEQLRTRLEDSKRGPVEKRIREAIALANNAIFRQAEQRPEWQGMGCVLTVAVVEAGRLHWGHVGDTRLYKIHKNAIRKVTRDHSPVGEREDANEITEREAMQHPRRNEVYRDVGSALHNPEDERFIDTGSEEFEPDAAFLLCSDGLSDVLMKDEIRAVVSECAGNPKRVTGRLIEMAAETGKDNISAVYIEGEKFAPRGSRVGEDTEKWRPQKKSRRWLAAVLGAVFGVVAGGAVGYQAAVSQLPRTLEVGPTGVASIAEALEKARPGDTVLVAAGDYREQVRLKSGVAVVAQGQVGLLGLDNPAEPVVVADQVKGAKLIGFVLHPDENKWWDRGIVLRDSEVDLEQLEIRGATLSGVHYLGASGGSLVASVVRQNRGVGVLVEGQSRPLIGFNRFAENGRGVEWTSSSETQLRQNVFDRKDVGHPKGQDSVFLDRGLGLPSPLSLRGAGGRP